jgi:uncharacterized protein
VGEIFFHCDGHLDLSAVVLHGERDEGGGFRSTLVYPPPREEGRHVPLDEGLHNPPAGMDEFLYWQRDLYISKRGRETLVMEPESAQWTVLGDRYFALFELCRFPRTLRSLMDNPFAPPDETERFLNYLLSRNIVRNRDWPSLYNPVMPSPLHFPSFISIHVTESCNFKCSYCYADAPSSGKKMKKETALAIIDKVFRDFTRQDITIEFHGGEPLLARDVVKAACERIRSHKAAMPGRECRVLLQTNGSLITEEDCAFFNDHDISVGVSMDGPPGIHDAHRIYRDGRGTHEAAIRGLELLRRHGINGGVLAVVQDPRDYVAICSYILSLGYTGFRLNHMVCQGRGEVDLNDAYERGEQFAREFMHLLDFLADYSRDHPGLVLDVWPLNIMLFHLVSSHRPFMCMRSPCGAGSHGIGFDYRGDIYPCEQLAGFEELSMGNVADERSLMQIVEESPVVRAVRDRKVERIEKCRSCIWRNFCGGGCTAESFSVFKCLDREDIHCSFFGRTFENLMWELHHRGDLEPLMGQFRPR